MTPEQKGLFDAEESAGEANTSEPEPTTQRVLSPIHVELPESDPTKPLWQARLELSDGLKDGARCPCCGRLAKLSRRRLSVGMVTALQLMEETWTRAPDLVKGSPWVHASRVFVLLQGKHRDWQLLEHWGLIETVSVRSDALSEDATFWRPTTEGFDFLAGKRAVKRYVLLYDGRFVDFDGLLSTARDIIGDRFDLERKDRK